MSSEVIASVVTVAVWLLVTVTGITAYIRGRIDERNNNASGEDLE